MGPPINRAYDLGKAEGHASGKAEGQAAGVAKSIETILRQRFPGQVPANLGDRLLVVADKVRDDILRRCSMAQSVAEALGPDLPKELKVQE